MMCDCAEEAERRRRAEEEERRRREEEEKEKKRLNQLMREKSGSTRDVRGSVICTSDDSGPCCDDADSCGFLTAAGGVGSGGGGWLPLAGTALMLAMLAYVLKYFSKVCLGNGKPTKNDNKSQGTAVIVKNESQAKAGRRVNFECPIRK